MLALALSKDLWCERTDKSLNGLKLNKMVNHLCTDRYEGTARNQLTSVNLFQVQIYCWHAPLIERGQIP